MLRTDVEQGGAQDHNLVMPAALATHTDSNLPCNRLGVGAGVHQPVNVTSVRKGDERTVVSVQKAFGDGKRRFFDKGCVPLDFDEGLDEGVDVTVQGIRASGSNKDLAEASIHRRREDSQSRGAVEEI